MISTFRRIVEPLPLKDARYPFPVFSSVLTFTATILLCFVALSTPWTKSVTLMDYDYNSLPPYFSPDMIREGADWYEGFGCFGYTSRGSEYSLGYEIHFRIPNFDDSKVNNALTRRLTKALILHPLAALLALTTFYTSLTTPVFSLRWTNIFLASATSVTLVTFTIDVVLWTTFRNNMSKLYIRTRYGNGFWMTFASVILLSLAFWSSSGLRFRRPRNRPVVPRPESLSDTMRSDYEMSVVP